MNDIDYMKIAIELAKNGVGKTAPNPMVGAVIVKDGRIIGKGYHQKYGEYHAERNAFLSLTESAENATIYVTLEPCCHYGKTPPCTEVIIENKISRVVIGSRDPNPLVSGKGVAKLQQAGIKVEQDCMKEECDKLNTIFFHYIITGYPYVTMKYAMTLDGKIATKTGKSKWITGEQARYHVHKLRGQYSVVMAGIGTVLADNPLLNCRIDGGHQPTRVIVDSHLRIPLNSQICQTAQEYKTIIACAENNNSKFQKLEKLGITVLCLPDTTNNQVDLFKLIQWLGKNKYDSVFIEGGGKLHESALRSGIVNHICAYVAPKIFGGEQAKTAVEGFGVESPEFAAKFKTSNITVLGDDLLLEYDIIGGMNNVYRNC